MTERERRSRNMLVILVAASLLMVAAYSWSVLSAAKAEATSSQQSLADCRALVTAIQELNQQPRVIALTASSRAAVSQQVEDAVTEAQLPVDSLLSVDLREAERIGNTPYVNQPTSIELEQATLPQILQLARGIEAKSAGFRVRDLMLKANPDSRAGRELWDVEAVLTQTVFSPKTK